MSAVSTVYSNVKSLRTAIKDINRLRQIALVLSKYGFGWFINKIQLTESLGLKNKLEDVDPAKSPLSNAKRLRMCIEDLGPTFIKLGQIHKFNSF